MRPTKSNVVAELRRIISDLYDVDSIVRELIQNADDARAERFHLAWSEGWSDAPHPLLKGPYIYVLNDGEFTEENAAAICEVNVSPKARDVSQIGKYGLGMKAIYHLCEGYFFLASENQPVTPPPFCEFTTPWPLDRVKHWEENEKTTSLLRNRIQLLPHGCSRWFCIAIPLRTPDHEIGGRRIKQNFPTIEKFFEKQDLAKTAEVMPLLKHLKSITIWDWAPSIHGYQRRETLYLDGPSSKLATAKELEPGECRAISKRIAIETRSSATSTVHHIQIAGREWLLKDSELYELKASVHWPKKAFTNPETDEEQDLPEKANSHCAAIFLFNSKASAGLEIRHSVFLPMKDPVEPHRSNGEEYRFKLFLHGYFFLDSGRKKIQFLDDTPTTSLRDEQERIVAEWNRRLYKHGVLQLILPALEEMATRLASHADDVDALTSEFRKTNFYETQQSNICKHEQWVFRLSLSDDCLGTWTLLPGSTSVFKLPSAGSADEKTLLLSLFPSLVSICNRWVITIESRPGLSASGPQDWGKDPELIGQLLESIEIESLLDPLRLSYVAELLESITGRPQATFQHLIRIGRLTLVARGTKYSDEWTKAFRRFARALGNDAWVGLKDVERDATAIIHKANTLDLQHMLLPSTLVPPEAQGAQLTLAECTSIATWLATMPTDRPQLVSAIALRIIESTHAFLDDIRGAIGSLPLILLRNLATAGEALSTWEKLAELNQSERLFDSRGTFAVPLAKALCEEIAILVAPSGCSAFTVLFGDSNSRQCDRASCLRILSQAPVLAEPKQRIELLTILANRSPNDDEAFHGTAVRYLLHGSKEHINYKTYPLFATQTMKCGGLLVRIAYGALGESKDEWRIISDCLCERLTKLQQQQILVQEVDAKAVAGLLDDVREAHGSFTWLNKVEMTDDEAESVLLELAQFNEEEFTGTWRKLPLHRAAIVDTSTPTQRIDASSEYCFIHSGESDPALGSLDQIVTLVRQPRNHRLANYYKEYGVGQWGSLAKIAVALSLARPSDHVYSILSALTEIAITQEQLPPDLLAKLRTNSWLPTQDGPVSPQEIVYLPEIEPALGQFLFAEKRKSRLKCLSTVTVDLIGSHEQALSVMRGRAILPNENQAIELLGASLGEVEAWRIGELSLPDDPQKIMMVVNAFRGCHGLPVVFSLLESIVDRFADNLGTIATSITPRICQPTSLQNLHKCVTQLASNCADHNRPIASMEATVLRWYLELLSHHANFTVQLLDGIRLPNRTGQWTSSALIGFDPSGIEDRYVLHHDFAGIFPPAFQRYEQTSISANADLEVSASESVESIRAYFTKWEGTVPAPNIGGFMALLGDSPEILEKAESLLHPRTVKSIREEINKAPRSDSLMVGANEDLHQKLAKQRFRFQFKRKGAPILIKNLLGHEFEAHVASAVSTVFIGNLYDAKHETCDGLRLRTIILHEFDPEVYSRDQLADILRESARVLLSEIYNHRSHELDLLWKHLSETSQLQLEIAQGWILNSAWAFLDQLGSRRMHQLKALLKERERLEQRSAELQYSKTQNQDDHALKEEYLRLGYNLRKLIEEDAKVQAETLLAVKEKMKGYQYSPASIPFELFQNADDAVAELAEMLETSHPPNDAATICISMRLINQSDDWRLSISHWGRPINQFCSGMFTAERGRDRGYHTDLKKMLLLSASDKSEREELVTGKFGLGFKTVFLVTDCPRVLSGDLGFEVVGGFFPKRLSSDDQQRLKKKLSEQKLREKNGTIVELDVGHNQAEQIKNGLTEFEAALPVMLAFSRSIKSCEIERQDSRVTIRSEELPVPGVKSASLFRIETSSLVPFKRALVIRDGQKGALLIAMSGDGAMGIRTPAYWVTAPTQAGDQSGYALNGDFCVDVGRTQIARSREGGILEQNLHVARRLGSEVGHAFVELFDAMCTDTGVVKNQLGLRQDLPLTAFWKSIWEVLTSDVGEPDGLRSETLWGRNLGLAALITTRPALPTGLCGDHDVLTEVREIRGLVRGILDHESQVFELASVWPGIARAYPPGSLVSLRKIGTRLKAGIPEGMRDLTEVSLKTLVDLETENQLVLPNTANRLGELITRESLGKWEKMGREYSQECEELVRLLDALQFKTRTGHKAPTHELLIGNADQADKTKIDEDELLRAAFAPLDRILDSQYQGAGLEFFIVCRKGMNAEATVLAEWATSTSDIDQQRAAVQYLLKGNLRSQLAGIVREKYPNSWLQCLTADQLAQLGIAEKGEQHRILSLLTVNYDDLSNRFRPPTPELILPPADPGPKLKALLKWWEANGIQELESYERALYPPEFSAQLLRDTSLSPAARESWLSVFLLGMLHTIGWTNDGKNRRFLELCNTHGFLSAFARINEDRHAWLNCWDAFFEDSADSVEYLLHMRQLLGLYIIARWLDEYVDAFRAINKIDADFKLTCVTSPRSSSIFSGGGPNAPSISRILGIGACFVVRELVRHGVIANPRAHRWCFVPRGQTRRFLREIGGPSLEDIRENRWERSPLILNFLKEHLGEQAHFGGAFDIPLIIAARSKDSETGLRPHLIHQGTRMPYTTPTSNLQ